MNFTAVLFVGGESRRMGADKATLCFAGEPLWSRQLRLLEQLSPDKILISARTKPVWCPAAIEMVLDETPSRGPLSGLAAALNKMTTTHLLALAVDVPLMTAEHLRWLMSQAVSGCGVVPTGRGRAEPLVAIYPAESGRLARESLAGADVSVNFFVEKLRGRKRLRDCELSLEMEQIYWNVNTPEEFSGASAIRFKAGG